MGGVWSSIGSGEGRDTDEWVREKLCIVTGANRGLGYYTALYLARMGARVILACRNVQLALQAREEIARKSGNSRVEVMELDLASLESVRHFAREFARRGEPLHVLVNNACVFLTPQAETVDGFERQFQTNYLGHFLLTQLLLPSLAASGEGRIVNVSSQVHRHCGKIEWDDPQMKKKYNPWRAYGRSKLLIIMSSYELARRLQEEGCPVTVNVVDPFVADTRAEKNSNGWKRWISVSFKKVVGVNPEKAATTFGWVASSPDLRGVNGQYYIHKKRLTKSSKASYNQENANHLWNVSLSMVGLAPSQL